MDVAWTSKQRRVLTEIYSKPKPTPIEVMRPVPRDYTSLLTCSNLNLWLKPPSF